MLNNCSLVGRLTADPKVYSYDDGGKVITMYLAVARVYGGKKGSAKADYILCKLFGNKTKILMEYCKKGDIVGFVGRVESKTIVDEEGNRSNEQFFNVKEITLFPKATNEVEQHGYSSNEVKKGNGGIAKKDMNKVIQQQKEDDLPF